MFFYKTGFLSSKDHRECTGFGAIICGLYFIENECDLDIIGIILP